MKQSNTRIFQPGSEWLYLKIYCGEFISDSLICKFSALSIQLIREKYIDLWFFIRYYDPKFHLRIRLHLLDIDKLSAILTMINIDINEEVQDGLIELVQVDTYIREIERYGGNVCSMKISEHIFYSDSMAIGNFLLSIIKDSNKENLRWIFGIVAINQMLEDFQFSLKEKMVIMETITKYYMTDFNKGKYLNNQIEKKFKRHEHLLLKVLEEDSNILFSDITNKRSKLYQSKISDMVNISNKGMINKNIRDLVSSYLHMSCNRIFRIEVRKHEYILYQILLRYYKNKYYASLKNKNL